MNDFNNSYRETVYAAVVKVLSTMTKPIKRDWFALEVNHILRNNKSVKKKLTTKNGAYQLSKLKAEVNDILAVLRKEGIISINGAGIALCQSKSKQLTNRKPQDKAQMEAAYIISGFEFAECMASIDRLRDTWQTYATSGKPVATSLLSATALLADLLYVAVATHSLPQRTAQASHIA